MMRMAMSTWPLSMTGTPRPVSPTGISAPRPLCPRTPARENSGNGTLSGLRGLVRGLGRGLGLGMARGLVGGLVIAAMVASPFHLTVSAGEIDRFDLDSISLQPAYISASLLRQSSCLRAVAVSPPRRTPNAPDTRVVVAVGDAGTILRSADDGETWQAVENIHLDTPASETPFGQSPRRSEQPPSIPFCEFTDVLWASPLDVIVVGGGYEPVTGISRGICVLSRDGGQNWYLGDAHELPRLQKLRMGGPSTVATARPGAPRELAPGVLEATGDASEASGVDRFYSYNGGQTWVEDIRASGAENSSASSVSHSQAAHPPHAIQTAAGSMSVYDLTRPDDGVQFAVSTHGRIWRRGEPQSAWQAVRGSGRGTAVLFVAASPAAVPWSLVGRESLHEHRRTAVLLDNAKSGVGPESGVGPAQSGDRNDLGRCRAAAAMLGSSDVQYVAHDAERSNWLAEHRPAVVVLDESLTPATQRAWWALVQQFRTRPASPTQPVAATDWSGPQRVILTRRVNASEDQSRDAARASKAWYSSEADPRWQRAWNHPSVLRGNALLSRPGVLANDIATDAFMLAAPQQSAPPAIEMATLDDASGTVRRDVALAAGLALDDGQNRGAAETLTASNRRLQITTARMNLTRRLHEEMFHPSQVRRSRAEQSRLSERIEQLLAGTAAEDRSRLLWDAMSVAMTTEGESSHVREVIMSLISRYGQPAALQRWADLNIEVLSLSVERRSPTSPNLIANWHRNTPQVLGNVAGSLVRSASSNEPPTTTSKQTEASQSLSPFQISPVTYEEDASPLSQTFSPAYSTAASAQRTAPAVILVPESKPIPWQPTRGWNALATPFGNRPGTDAPSRTDEGTGDFPARINWDYHPVVMAARGIAPADHGSGTPLPDSRSASDSEHRVARYSPPRTADRPLLDGVCDDPCWSVADCWSGDSYEARCVADSEYVYFAISAAGRDGVRLSLDCDGDYFTAIRFEISRDGTHRVSVDAVGAISPVWYTAVANKTDSATSGPADGPLLAEVAIARSSLPAPMCRVHIRPGRTGAQSQWEVMPQASQWHPAHAKSMP